MAAKRILSVGQCGFDHGNLAATVKGLAWELVPCASAAEAHELLATQPFDLVLVNRVFDADGDSGLAFIRKVKSTDATRSARIMLVSNYPDSQADAVAAGALPGFGKSSLQHPGTLELLRTAMAE